MILVIRRFLFEEALTHTIINYEKILVQIKEKLPETQVYMMAHYPVKEDDPLPEGNWAERCLKIGIIQIYR